MSCARSRHALRAATDALYSVKRYFGRAKDLPGVKELFDASGEPVHLPPSSPPKLIFLLYHSRRAS